MRLKERAEGRQVCVGDWERRSRREADVCW